MQRYITNRCNTVGKPVILQTQIMDSMKTRLRPTRSEVCDVAEGVSDGLDGMILSAETATGRFPNECTEAVSQICYETEQNLNFINIYQTQQGQLKMRLAELMEQDENLNLKALVTVEETLAHCAVRSSFDMKASLILAFTHSSHTAQILVKHKPRCPILVVTPNSWVANSTLLHRGTFSMIVGSLVSSSTLL